MFNKSTILFAKSSYKDKLILILESTVGKFDLIMNLIPIFLFKIKIYTIQIKQKIYIGDEKLCMEIKRVFM